MRTANLQAFRAALCSLACQGDPFDARDRLVVVPTRAAALHLVRTIEDRYLRVDSAPTLESRPSTIARDALSAVEGRTPSPEFPPVAILPDMITARELVSRVAERLPSTAPILNAAERQALLGAACRAARADGVEPPFRLRPGLLAEMLDFYDTLRRNQKDVETFERLALGVLEPGASYDRGAERLVRQTRFLVAAFRHFERTTLEHGVDEHTVRRRVLDEPARRPYRHVVIAVSDRAFDPHGLSAADWDLLARAPGLQRIDVVVTDTVLAGALHEHVHRMLPGIEEVRVDAGEAVDAPRLAVPSRDAMVHVARDREEEIAAFARSVKHAVRSGRLASLDRAALVVYQPLPYVYLAREVLRSAGVPCQMVDALPLAAEPYAAAFELIATAVTAGFARGPAIALLRSPHFVWPGAITAPQIAALDRALAEAGYLGGLDALERLVDEWRGARAETSQASLAAIVLLDLARELAPLQSRTGAADHVDVLLRFLTAHEAPQVDERGRRARAAIRGILLELRDAYARFDREPVDFDDAAALIRRSIEEHTFAPRSGRAGVHVVDASSARFGDFDEVHLAGLVEGEWPDRPRRNVFYSPGLLRELGWPPDAQRREATRAAFIDLLRLPRRIVKVSSFSLEDDAIVSGSVLLDELDAANLETLEQATPLHRIFDFEALAMEPPRCDAIAPAIAAWARDRVDAPHADDVRFRGATAGHSAPAFSLSALERYQDCPFKFFAGDVLGLEEAPEDESSLTPRRRGRFLHEVFERFFRAWDAAGHGPVTVDRLEEARRVAADVVQPLLEQLPESDRALERTRLFGSAITIGTVDLVLGLEASRPTPVKERWLEYRLEGQFSLGASDGRRVPLRGVADRIDLLGGRRLRVVDYKSGAAPDVKRALQAPIYALCAQERLGQRDGAAWTIDEAAYVAFGSRRPLVPVIKPGAADGAAILASARERLLSAVDGISRGDFPPRPHDPMICGHCAHASVCRKDYVAHE